MSKVHYLNNHLEKYREKKIIVKLEDLPGIALYSNIGDSDPKVIKLFIKCFKNKDNHSLFLNKLPKNLTNLDKYVLISKYWFAFIVYYNENTYEQMIGDCLEHIDENKVLLDSPHFCKKVFYYLNSPKIINNN